MVAVRGGAGRLASRAPARAASCSSGGSTALGMDKSFGGGLERNALEDALPHPGKHLAGADLHEGGRSGLMQGNDGLAPAHGLDQRVRELFADVLERRRAGAGEDG